MSILDIIISLVVFAGLWRGYHYGMIKTLSSFIAWLFGLIVASKTAHDFAIFFSGMTQDLVIQTALAFLSIMLAIVVIVQIISGVIMKTLTWMKLGFLDKLMGGVFGAMTGVLKILVVLSVAAPLLIKTPTWQTSVLAQSLLPFSPFAQSLLQKSFNEIWKHLENPYKNPNP